MLYSQVHNDRTAPIIMAGCSVHARNRQFPLPLLNLTLPSCSLTPISCETRKFWPFTIHLGIRQITSYLHGFSGPLNLQCGFMGKIGLGGAILTTNELVFNSGGSYVDVNFGENRSRNARL